MSAEEFEMLSPESLRYVDTTDDNTDNPILAYRSTRYGLTPSDPSRVPLKTLGPFIGYGIPVTRKTSWTFTIDLI